MPPPDGPHTPNLPGAFAIDARERAAVLSTLEPEYLAAAAVDDRGFEASWVSRFEHRLAEGTRARFAVATNSGTSALFASLLALDLQPGDEVVIPAYGYVGCVAAVLNAGGVPVIAGVDRSFTLDPAALGACIAPRTRAVLLAHMRGVPADLDALREVIADRPIHVLEDAAQACGATYRGEPVGGHATMGCFSFHSTKTITAHEGGAVVTDDANLYERLRYATDLEFGHGRAGPARRPVGLNLKMSHLSAALACVQYDRLPQLVASMRERSQVLRDAVREGGSFSLRAVPEGAEELGSSVVFLAADATAALAARGALRRHGVGAHVLYVDGEHNWRVFCCWEPLLAAGRHRGADGHATLELLRRAVHIDVSPHMPTREVNRVADLLTRLTPQGELRPL